MRRLLPGVLAIVAASLLTLASPATAKLPVLQPASYPGMTTFNCRTDAIVLQPGQNLNRIGLTKACPNAEVVDGPLGTDVFAAGSDAEGYITRFKPSMVEIKPGGRLVTPAVWDLHLHHVVWNPPGGGTLAAGEEKTIAMLPQGFGIKLAATADWLLVHMLHNLTAQPNRSVYLTWQIDWVPETEPARTDIERMRGTFMDVAKGGIAYPVFDAEKRFDGDGDGEFVFPDDVSADPGAPSHEERGKISEARSWTVPSTFTDGITLISAGGHLHPGGLFVDLRAARDGPDPGEVDGDDPAEVRSIFRSDAHYYEPAGAVSWDVAMTVARRDWRIHLEPGDTVSIGATYDVERASWYESMGILSLGWTPNADPAAKDPFVDEAAVREMYESGGALTHRRLPENVDTNAREDLDLPDPRKLRSSGMAPLGGLTIDSFFFERRGLLRRERLPGEGDATARGAPRPVAHVRQQRRPPGPAGGGAGLAYDHRLPSALHGWVWDRLSPGQRPRPVRLGAAGLRRLPQLERDDRLEHLHDPAAQEAAGSAKGQALQARLHLHVLLPPAPVHARIVPGSARRLTRVADPARDGPSCNPLDEKGC